MARGKKKEENLTLEEKLEQALVPEEEWPYEVPGNWCWAFLTRGFAECKDSYRKPVNASERTNREGDIPYYGATGQVGWIDDFLTDEELVLLGEDGAPFLQLNKDKAYIISGKAWVNNHAHILSSYTGSIGNKYLMNYLNVFNYNGYVNGTTRLKLTQSSMARIPIPVCPPKEQERIVNQLEQMFAKLDESKEKVQLVLESSEDRKAAIFLKAFSGKLTEQWRKEQGIEGDSWKAQKLSSLGKLERGKSKHRPRNDPSLFGDKYPFIQTGDISEAQIYIKEHKQSLSEIGLKQSRLFPAGTLCITIAANIGNVAILSYDCCFPDSVVGFTPNAETDSKFIYYIMCTMQKKLEAEAPATAQKNINLKVLNDITLNTPSLSEQHEIVKILDELLEKENRVEIICENIFTQIDLLKKSILSRAFRGELGTNNPNEESAIELLKTIL